MRLGNPLPLPETALASLAKITEADMIAGKSLVQNSAPLRFRTLLDATLVNATLVNATVTAETLYAWDPKTGQYIYLPTGRRVPTLEVRSQVIEPIIARSKQLQRAISAQLQNKEISLAEWQTQMISQIKPAQVAAALAANGGVKNTSDSDKEEIALLILALLLLFRNFSEEIQAGSQALNGRLLVRSDLYANAARGMFEDVVGYFARVYLGKTQERRVLGIPEHCHTVETRADSIMGTSTLVGCVELSELGWQSIGSLPRIGHSPCRANCKCHKEYR